MAALIQALRTQQHSGCMHEQHFVVQDHSQGVQRQYAFMQELPMAVHKHSQGVHSLPPMRLYLLHE